MRKIAPHWIVLTTYALLAVVMSYPLILHLGGSIPGVEGDAPSFVWALGWMKTALVDLGTNPFHTDFVFYPLGGATQLLWAVSLIGVLALPLQIAFGPVAAYNLTYLAATVLTAYGTFLLAREVLHEPGTANQRKFDARPLPPFGMFLVAQFVIQNRVLAARRATLAPFVAGLAFAFAPLRLGYGLAFFNLFNTQLVPFYLLFLLRATRRASWRATVLAGAFLGLNAYIDFQIAAFLIVLTALWAAYTILYHRDTRTHLRAVALRWGVAGLVSLTVAAPLFFFVAQDFALEGGNYIRVFKLDYSAARSYDLFSLFVPNARSSLYAGAPLKVANVNAAVQADDESALSPDRQPFLGYVSLALAAYAVVRRRRQARFWLAAAVVFGVLSLGPWLHIAGQATGIPLPYIALHEIPILNHIRIPMRYGIVVALAVALMVGIAVDRLQTTLETWKREIRQANLERLTVGNVVKVRLAGLGLWLIPLGILLEYAVLPYPVQAFSVPRIYETIRRMPGDFTVLEIPTFNWRAAAATEAYQPVHGKRILRAYTNRIAPGPAEYFASRGTPIVVRSLRALEGIDKDGLAPEDTAEDRQVREEVLQFYDVRYAVLHSKFLAANVVESIRTYLVDVLGARLVEDDGETLAYELPHAAVAGETTAIDLRENIGQMYAGRGWAFQYPPANWNGEFNFVWARGTRSEVYFLAGDARTRSVTVRAFAETPQSVRVFVNGQVVGQLELTPEWQDHTVAVGAPAIRSGMNRLELVYGAELNETIGITTFEIRRGQDGAQKGH